LRHFRRLEPVDSLTTSQGDPEAAAAPVPTTATKAATTFRFALAALWTLVIMALCWMPRYIVQEVERGSSFFEIPNFDKLVHWGIFVVFSLLWLRTSTARWRYAWVALGGLAVAGITELVQNVPAIGRDASVADAATDLVGVAIGLAVARWVEPLLSRLESRLLRPLGW
jgi:hypothetical protein